MQNHPLIPREQTYVLDRKLISFHSIDRDYKKWPHANHFEIMFPDSLKNVQSMRLDTISLPSNHIVFSNQYQNTKLSFSLEPYSETHTVYTITIDEGSYTPVQLALEIQTKMNKKITEKTGVGYDEFECKYNEITNQFWFGNKKEFFSLRFDIKIDYGLFCPNQPIMFNKYTNWGLPSYLGYQKKIYESTLTPPTYFPPSTTAGAGAPFAFDYEFPIVWLDGVPGPNVDNYYVDVKNPQFSAHIYDPTILAETGLTKEQTIAKWKKDAKICDVNIFGEDIIYMEVEKYNSMDEICPYSENTSNARNNDYHGSVKSAFAKIPLISKFSQVHDSRNSFLMNVSQYEPPLERLTRLKFKFRYHDGRLVDFNCLPLSFTIEFNMLRDEQLRARITRIPPLYRL